MSHFDHVRESQLWSSGLLAVLCVLAIVEKLSAIVNSISIERDWVVVVADGDDSQLRTLNSQMRRIDLFCKLVGPLAISFIDTLSSEAAILTTGMMTVTSIAVEYFAIARVYRAVPALRKPRDTSQLASSGPDTKLWSRFRNLFDGTRIYISHPAFLPSFALSLLYLTVLSFAGQMITYLLALGVSSGAIGMLRGVAAGFEMSATWLAPKIMEHIGPVRAGIWFLNFQILCVGAASVFLWLDLTPIVAVVGTVCAVIASRIGLWGFDLSVQIIVQEEVDSHLRGTFSSQEFAFQNMFEMLSFASTVALARPDQFKYPATISAGAVGLAGVLYATFVRARRGHLVHWSRCMERHQKYGDCHATNVGDRDDPADERLELSDRG